MITCEIFRRHVDAVVDGEVDPDTQIEVDEHLTSCGPCRVHMAFCRSFKSRVHGACGGLEAPPGLAERVRSALDAEDARRVAADPHAPVASAEPARLPLGLGGIRFRPVKTRYAVPAAAAAVALAVIAGREGGNPITVEEQGLAVDAASAMPASSIFEDVVRRHSNEHPAEVSGPPTRVASWFRGKLRFPVRPIQFAGQDVRLVGARISSVRDRDAAAFYYVVSGHRVTVMVFEPPGRVDRLARRTRVRGRGIHYVLAHGHTVPLVHHDGLTYAIAGDLDSRSLLQLAATARVQER